MSEKIRKAYCGKSLATISSITAAQNIILSIRIKQLKQNVTSIISQKNVSQDARLILPHYQNISEIAKTNWFNEVIR